QYLLNVERAIFFDYMDALGISRYLPLVLYAKGAPDKAGYVGHRLRSGMRMTSAEMIMLDSGFVASSWWMTKVVGGSTRSFRPHIRGALGTIISRCRGPAAGSS